MVKKERELPDIESGVCKCEVVPVATGAASGIACVCTLKPKLLKLKKIKFKTDDMLLWEQTGIWEKNK